MTHRYIPNALLIIALLIALFVLAVPVLAGGWAVVTLKDLPDHAVVGQPLNIDFAIRQHGKTPWVSDAVAIQAMQTETSSDFTVKAVADPETPGHYTATLNFPKPGRWTWAIQSGLFPDHQPMPDLEVIGPAAAAPVNGSRISVPLLAGLMGLAAAVIFGVVLRRRQTLLAAGAMLICLAVSVFAFTRAVGVARSAADSPSINAQAISPPSQVELGRRLFLAKGCVVCHLNRNAGNVLDISVELGPDLTQVTKDARYLEYWLSDPSAVKPDTSMPKLGLSQDEIEALIAFLNPAK